MLKLKIFILICIFTPVLLFSETEVFYHMSFSPEIPSVGRAWRIMLLIDFDVPEEAAVIAPMFTPFFRTERVVKLPRAADAYRSEVEHEWSSNVITYVEYTLIPEMDGLFFLGSFSIITPDSMTSTESMLINIRERIVEIPMIIPRMYWEEAPQVLEKGERAFFSLRLTNFDTSTTNTDIFLPEVPQGVILSNIPLSDEEKQEGFAARFSLVLLENDFYLPPRTIRRENTIFNIPALRIRVTQNLQEGEDTMAEESEENILPEITEKPAFPAFNISDSNVSFFENLFFTGREDQCEEIYNTARNMWNNGNYAATLSHLRQNERRHPSGVYLRQIRKEAEEKLGIFNTENESIRGRVLLSGFSFFILIFVIIIPFVCYILLKKPEFTAKKLRLPLCVFIILLFSFVLLRFSGFQSFILRENGRYGISFGTLVRSLPDYNSAEVFSIREGQPVVIMLNGGEWLYVRTNDAERKTGWIQAGSLIFY